jgi:hypothetical protein
MLKDEIEINYFFLKKEKKSIITLIMSPKLTLRKKNHKKYKKAKLYIKKRIKKGKKHQAGDPPKHGLISKPHKL